MMSATPMLRSLSAPATRPHSPSPKKLSARDTPFGLFDPHGHHSRAANVGVSSTLTIVRMPYAAAESKAMVGEDGGRRKQTQLHARSISSSSLRSGTSGSPVSHTARLSFANNSFAHAPQKNTRPSPSLSSFHTRSASTPVNSLRQARNQTQALQRLSPHQIYTSAKDARAPWTGYPRNGVREAVSKSFNPLPAHIILPFASRSSEVSELFLGGANAKLLILLSHVFPAASDASSDIGSPPSSAPLDSKLPEDWNFADLRFWLFNVDRAEVVDALWVRTLRRAILSRSEVLWERVKAVLGVPFDLDAVAELPPIPWTIREEGQRALSLDFIHPTSKGVGGALQKIAEDEGEDEGNAIGEDVGNVIVGLRFTSRLPPVRSSSSPPVSKRSSSPSRSPRLPLRSLSQNSVPTVSSPLAGRPAADVALTQSMHKGTKSYKANRTSLFPSSFSALGLKLRSGSTRL